MSTNINILTERGASRYPLFFESINYLLSHFPLYKKTYLYILNHFDQDYFSFAERICQLLLKKTGSKERYLHALDSLIKFSLEYLRLQNQLMRTGSYFNKDFSKVNESVYQNQMMENYYLDALFLSEIFWPNHYKMILFFKSFCTMIQNKEEGMEVPCGTGIFSYLLLNQYPHKKMDLFDISAYSTNYTQQLLKLSGLLSSDLKIETANIFDLKNRQYDFIICGELIEHLENPLQALIGLNHLLHPSGLVFLTTAIYTAALDHLWLFNNVEEVRQMLAKAGFLIQSELVLPLSLDKSASLLEKEPLNYACVLMKNKNFR